MTNATVNRIASDLRREDRDLTIVEAVASARRMMVEATMPVVPVVRVVRTKLGFERLDRR